MVSYGLFSISLRRARIRSAVVSRGDICNPRTPFTLVSSTKSLVHRLSAPTDTGPGLSHKERASRWEDASPSYYPLLGTRWGAADCTNRSGILATGRSPSPLQGSRPFFVTLLGRWTRLRLARSVDPGVHPLQDAAAVLVLGLVIPQALDLFRAQRLDPVGHLIGA